LRRLFAGADTWLTSLFQVQRQQQKLQQEQMQRQLQLWQKRQQMQQELGQLQGQEQEQQELAFHHKQTKTKLTKKQLILNISFYFLNKLIKKFLPGGLQ
jgi:hypothetical protein